MKLTTAALLLVTMCFGVAPTCFSADMHLGLRMLPGEQQFDETGEAGAEQFAAAREAFDRGDVTTGMASLQEAVAMGNRPARLVVAQKKLSGLFLMSGISELNELAQTGFYPAKIVLAHYYLQQADATDEPDTNNAAALVFIEALMKEEVGQGFNMMGLAYLKGRVAGGKDVAEAITHFEQAIELKCFGGRVGLAKALTDEADHLDPVRARALLEENIELGDSVAMFNLALQIHKNVIPGSPGEAGDLFRTALDSGFEPARSYVASYESGMEAVD